MAFGGFNQQSNSAPMSDINVTPMVDLMLVLVIIFMITAPLLTHSVPIQLPVTGTSATPEQPDTITISLNKEGELFWNNTPLPADALTQKLATVTAAIPPPEVHIRADRETRYQKIAELMTTLQQSGVQKVGFVSQLTD